MGQKYFHFLENHTRISTYVACGKLSIYSA